MKKFYLFYKISTNNLYAFTMDKEYANQFMEIRNMKLFRYKEVKMDKYESMLFLNEYHRFKLEKIPLTDGDGNHEIIGTEVEDAILTESCEQIFDRVEGIRIHLCKNVPFNEKTKDILKKATNIVKYDEKYKTDLCLEIDCVHLFYHLFRDTFFENHEILNHQSCDD